MKILILLSVFTLININLMAVDFKQIALYKSGIPTPYNVEDIHKILDDFEAEDPNKDILFYVHGRSRTLEKVWGNSITLENTRNLKVLMLHWNSWSNMVSRPLNNASEAGLTLKHSIHEIKKYIDSHPEQFLKKKIFFLSHSMGNLVVKSYVENYFDENLNANIFDAAIFNAPDVPYIDHKKWMDRLHFSENNFVLMNKVDPVLNASRLLDLKIKNFFDERLGMGIKLYVHTNHILSEHLNYFDVTYVDGFEHTHFLSNRKKIVKIFDFIFDLKTERNTKFTNDPRNLREEIKEKLDPKKSIKNVFYFKK